MGIRLERYRWKPLHPDYWEETDYTGRWKIKCENGECHLYIECFDIEIQNSVVVSEGYTEMYGIWPLRKERYIDTVREKLAKPKVKANVYWVREDSLRLVEEPKEYINQCGGMYE